MGLFGTDDPRADRVAAGARGESVTPDILTMTSRTFDRGNLADRPVLDHLREGEQPHYYFYNVTKGISRNEITSGGGMNPDYRSFCLITDQRVLLFSEGTRGDALSYGSIERAGVSHGRMKHRLSITTTEAEYELYTVRRTNNDELDAAADYIRKQAGESQEEGVERSQVDGLDPVWDVSSIPNASALDASPQGEYVTEARVVNIAEYLYDDEPVHYLVRGRTIRVGGAADSENIFGKDMSTSSSLWGSVWVAVTDRRIVIRTEKRTKEDGDRSIDLEDVIDADRESGVEGNRISIHVPSRTYHITVSEPDSDELREVVQFIRKWKPDDEPGASNPEVASAADRLRELQNLHDDGLLTDEEFKPKREELVDNL